MNMFKESSAKTVKDYFDAMSDDRRAIAKELDALIKKVAPKLTPHFASNMLGYGSFEYFDKRAKEFKPWPVVALANQKNYISLYVCAVEGGQYVAEKYAAELGKVSVGKSCIRIKKFDDIDLKVLTKVFKAAAKSPGMIGAETR